jgi:proteasome-associated ATPase
VKIEDAGLERVLQTSVGVKVGDGILVDASRSVVVQNIGNTSKAYKIDKVPEVPWSTIGGLENTISTIRQAIEDPVKYREIYAKFPNKKNAQGLLLYGPAGCGKTMLGKAVAYNLALSKKERDGGELNGYFMYVAGPEFLQKFVGTGEAKVREMFATARETAAENGDPVVIFIDEPEAVLKKRGSGISSDASDSIVNQMLCELDGLRSRDNIYLILASNREDIIDPAILRPGRIDKKIYVPRPSKESAGKIFEI